MDIKTLATMMDVKEQDVKSLLDMIVTEIRADKVDETFVNASEAQQVELVEAYMSAAIRKFQSFCVAYMTNQDKRKSFNEFMFTMMSK